MIGQFGLMSSIIFRWLTCQVVSSFRRFPVSHPRGTSWALHLHWAGCWCPPRRILAWSGQGRQQSELIYWGSGCDFENAIFNLVSLIGIFRSSYDNSLWWITWNVTDDKWTMVQVMAWCRQATSHYLNPFDPVLCHHMASLDHNELIFIQRERFLTYKWTCLITAGSQYSPQY